jgi:hypothetical protein
MASLSQRSFDEHGPIRKDRIAENSGKAIVATGWWRREIYAQLAL